MINVLIADNNRQFSTKLLKTLNRDDNIKILNIVNDGQSAITSYFNNRPDIFILELSLPKLNGLEVLEKIEYTLEEKSFCNVIIVTENMSLKHKISSTSKIYKICNKPIDIDELEKYIYELYSINNIKKKSDIKSQIIDILLSLKFNFSNKSTHYIIEAITIYYENIDYYLKLNDIYEKIALKCSTTSNIVKWNIDFAVKSVSKLLDEKDLLNTLPYYDSSKGLTSKNLITFIAELLEISET